VAEETFALLQLVGLKRTLWYRVLSMQQLLQALNLLTKSYFLIAPGQTLACHPFAWRKFLYGNTFFFFFRWYKGCLEFVKPIDPPGNVLTFSMYGGFLKQLSKIPSQIRCFLFRQLRACSN